MVQTEGSNVTLECVASGSPQPAVVWKREDGREIEINKNTTGGWWWRWWRRSEQPLSFQQMNISHISSV